MRLDVRESLGQVAVVEIMKERQKRWKEKLEGMDGDRLSKQVYEGDVEGRRPRGDQGRDVLTTLNRHVRTLRNLSFIYTIVISNHCMFNVYA